MPQSGTSQAYIINGRLFEETKAILEQMGGQQPTEQELRQFLMLNDPRPNGQGGAIDAKLHDRMIDAHNIAKAQATSARS